MASSDAYTATVRLLLRVLPVLQGQQVFALKGGTAINLFHQDLPRLSVDIDLAYLGVNSRAQALAEIHTELSRMAGVLTGQGLQVRGSPLTGNGEWIKLVVSDGRAQVKVEVSPVLRGAVFPAEVRQTSPASGSRRCLSWPCLTCTPGSWSRPSTASIRVTCSTCTISLRRASTPGRFTWRSWCT